MSERRTVPDECKSLRVEIKGAKNKRPDLLNVG